MSLAGTIMRVTAALPAERWSAKTCSVIGELLTGSSGTCRVVAAVSRSPARLFTSTSRPLYIMVSQIEVPWNQGTADYAFRLEILDADGHPVCAPQPDHQEPQPIVIEGS